MTETTHDHHNEPVSREQQLEQLEGIYEGVKALKESAPPPLEALSPTEMLALIQTHTVGSGATLGSRLVEIARQGDQAVHVEVREPTHDDAARLRKKATRTVVAKGKTKQVVDPMELTVLAILSMTYVPGTDTHPFTKEHGAMIRGAGTTTSWIKALSEACLEMLGGVEDADTMQREDVVELLEAIAYELSEEGHEEAAAIVTVHAGDVAAIGDVEDEKGN